MEITRTRIERPYMRNVCALPFIPGTPPQVLLLHRKTKDGVQVYDGFGGLFTHVFTDPLAGEKSCSEYIHNALEVLTTPEEWIEIVTLRGDDWEVSFYYFISEVFRGATAQRSHEDVSFEDAYDGLPLNTIPALRWLVPLALDDNVVKPLGLSGIKL